MQMLVKVKVLEIVFNIQIMCHHHYHHHLHNAAIRIRDNAVLINFYLQFFKFILMISGDIEVTPGPITDNILDIVNLNIRIIRHKISHLIL